MTLYKNKIPDFDERAFDLIRRYLFIVGSRPQSYLEEKLSDGAMRVLRRKHQTMYNNLIHKAEHFFAAAERGMQIQLDGQGASP